MSIGCLILAIAIFKNNRQRVVLACVIILVAGVVYLYMMKYPNSSGNIAKRSSNVWNNHAVDSCIELLQEGDLVVRRGDDMTSYMLSRMNMEDKRYSHCGLVHIENGYPFVYHSIGGEDNPDEIIRRDSANFWFSPINNLAFAIYRYNINDSLKERYMESAQEYYKIKLMFDLDFNLKSDERLYCSEMVYKAIKNTLKDSIFINTVDNLQRNYVGIDNLYMNPKAKLICQIRFK